MSEIENEINGSGTRKNSFFGKLSSGDFGLAKTFWLYGVVVGFIVNIATRPIASSCLIVVIILGYTAYKVPVLIGTSCCN